MPHDFWQLVHEHQVLFSRYVNESMSWAAQLQACGPVPVETLELPLPFGLPANGPAIQAWGAKAVLNPDKTVSFVAARTAYASQPGVTEARKSLFFQFVNQAVIPQLQAMVAVTSHDFPDSNRELGVEFGRLKFCASPLASNGYLSITVVELAPLS